MMNSSMTSGVQATDSYTDLASVNAIRDLGRDNKNQALEQISKQFESMMTRMMLKSMRSANDVFAKGNFLSSSEGDMYQEMFDDQISLSLSQGRGMGVAEVMVRQLKNRFGSVEKIEGTTELDQYLSQRNESSPNMVGLVSTKTNVDKGNVELSTEENHDAQRNNITFDGSSEQFIERLYPVAEKAAKEIGVEPQVLLAQSALETGWGKKITSSGDKSSFNFFNIKADSRWEGSTMTVPTIEIKNGIAVKESAEFRAYTSAQQSFDDYANFIKQSPRYEQALEAKNSEQYIQALEEAGYATDPNYSEKIIRILNGIEVKTASNSKQSAQLALAE